MAKRYEAALRIKPLYQKGAQILSDSEALEVRDIYPQWEELIGTAAELDFKFVYDGKLYKVIQAHSFQENWLPGSDTASLYTLIDGKHTGALADPIPYASGMALEQGKYYSQYDLIYLCTRSTGIAVYVPLAELVPLYVEEIKEEKA
ncbi:MAG: hypothetical protein IJE09_06295 [Oscillospiraceae bacterium]|nr:hypothetical protein [Oscillospiraceae bacterium]